MACLRVRQNTLHRPRSGPLGRRLNCRPSSPQAAEGARTAAHSNSLPSRRWITCERRNVTSPWQFCVAFSPPTETRTSTWIGKPTPALELGQLCLPSISRSGGIAWRRSPPTNRKSFRSSILPAFLHSSLPLAQIRPVLLFPEQQPAVPSERPRGALAVVIVVIVLPLAVQARSGALSIAFRGGRTTVLLPLPRLRVAWRTPRFPR